MSEAPHLELNTDGPALDLSDAPNEFPTSNGNSTQQDTKGSILGSEVGDRTAPPDLAEPAPNVVPVLSHTILCSAPLTTPTAAQSAMAAVANHPTTQGLKDSISNGEVRILGSLISARISELTVVSRHRCPKCHRHEKILTLLGPVGQTAKAETAKTRGEFADLANARTTPDQPAATGQPLTHYHSLFYRLLSWKNPRATAIAFASSVLFIFAARYLNVIRYIFKAVYLTLGATATAEVAGKLTFGQGFTSQFRPRKYFTIPKASLERLLDDVEQLINFFVIESQRIIFAENVYATVAVRLKTHRVTPLVNRKLTICSI